MDKLTIFTLIITGVSLTGQQIGTKDVSIMINNKQDKIPWYSDFFHMYQNPILTKNDGSGLPIIVFINNYRKEDLTVVVQGNFIIVKGYHKSRATQEHPVKFTQEFFHTYTLPVNTRDVDIVAELTNDGYLIINSVKNTIGKKSDEIQFKLRNETEEKHVKRYLSNTAQKAFKSKLVNHFSPLFLEKKTFQEKTTMEPIQTNKDLSEDSTLYEVSSFNQWKTTVETTHDVMNGRVLEKTHLETANDLDNKNVRKNVVIDMGPRLLSHWIMPEKVTEASNVKNNCTTV